ncbi:MAG: adenylosuccinate lyase [Treponema sp.]|jgi:adenylosuccinate lyase|nr:adenylosuccinate lyase [Treponema sp.]
MKIRSIFQNISPLDHRYSLSEATVFDSLAPFLSESASVLVCMKAEIALIKAHLRIRGCLSEALETMLDSIAIDPEEVYAEEEQTHHNIRALVNTLKMKVPPDLAPLVHLGATSVDILDTSLAYRIKGATNTVVLPLLKKLELLLCDFAEKEAETPQTGRTHGQQAVPITLGFAVAEYVSRLGKSILEIEERGKALKGKLAGAVGAYNATSMIVNDPEELERLYLVELGLEPSEHSTQLVEPEYLLRLLLEFNTAFGVLANLADDLRNLQRSEIGELKEGFSGAQVGSSTMPQKRNPWNSEHIKSLWKAFFPRVMTFFMDQISEHQRDLTNSASQRFVADYIVGFCMAISRMIDVVSSLGVDRDRLRCNLRSGGIPGGVMAEPAYILLAETGVSDAHEIIRRITLDAEKNNLSFASALSKNMDAMSRIAEKLSERGLTTKIDALSFFENPEKYCGLAIKKAKTLAGKYRMLMKKCDGV